VHVFEQCFDKSCFDFVRVLPMVRDPIKHIGYAFVNFAHAEFAKEAIAHMPVSGFRRPGQGRHIRTDSRQICCIITAV